MHLPTLRQLEYLMALKNHKNFSRAAQACHISQSALSNAIKELEDILRQPVVIRSTRRVSFTTAGAALAKVAEEIIGQLQEVTYTIQHAAQPMSGTIRLGVIPTIAPYLLPRAVSSVRAAFPSLNLEIYEGLSDDLIDKIRAGELETAFMAFPFPAAKGLYQHIFFEEQFYLAVPKDTFKTKDEVTTVQIETQTQQGLELLLLEDGHCLTDHALASCNLPRHKASQNFRASSLQTLIHMVAAGQGMTLLPEMAVQDVREFLPQTIDLITFKSPVPARKIGMAWPKDLYQEKDLIALAHTIEQSLKTSDFQK